MAIVSLILGLYQICYTLLVQLDDENPSDCKSVIDSLKRDLKQWHNNSAAMAASLLITCSVGLVTAYIVLIYNMRKYFKEQMRNEMRRLTVLFASFVLAYFLRSLY